VKKREKNMKGERTAIVGQMIEREIRNSIWWWEGRDGWKQVLYDFILLINLNFSNRLKGG